VKRRDQPQYLRKLPSSSALAIRAGDSGSGGPPPGLRPPLPSAFDECRAGFLQSATFDGRGVGAWALAARSPRVVAGEGPTGAGGLAQRALVVRFRRGLSAQRSSHRDEVDAKVSGGRVSATSHDPALLRVAKTPLTREVVKIGIHATRLCRKPCGHAKPLCSLKQTSLISVAPRRSRFDRTLRSSGRCVTHRALSIGLHALSRKDSRNYVFTYEGRARSCEISL
jgi:hypothetical protein